MWLVGFLDWKELFHGIDAATFHGRVQGRRRVRDGAGGTSPGPRPHQNLGEGIGYFVLEDDAQLLAVAERLRRGIASDASLSPSTTELLVLRALLTRDPADTRAAFDNVRPGWRASGWIRTEVWLEGLGCRLEPMETQWPIPYEQVRRNWLRIVDGVIGRDRQRMQDKAGRSG